MEETSRPVEAIIRRSARLLALVGGAALLCLMLLTVYAVVMRYAFNAPVLWALDVTRITTAKAILAAMGSGS